MSGPEAVQSDEGEGRFVPIKGACGWCGRTVYNWSIEGPSHYDGVCVGKSPGRAERVLADYHHGGYGERAS